ncbi:unnamed protein product, partial [Clonostachys rhizophaga]
MRLETIPEKSTKDSHVDAWSPPNPIWKNAMKKYYDELRKGGIEPSVIDKYLWKIQNLEDLFNQPESLFEVQDSQPSSLVQGLTQLRPTLLALNHFLGATSWIMGTNAKFAAVLWGSFRLILKYAEPVLPDVIDMIKSLEHALPRTQQYNNELPMTKDLEEALSNIYSEIILFCAYAIRVLRNSPDIAHNKLVRPKFSKDIYRIIENIQKFSRQVEKTTTKSSRQVNETAAMTRLSKATKNIETIAALHDSQIVNKPEDAKLPCFMIPYGLNLRFFGRENELTVLREALDPSVGTTLRAIGVYGLGGVGKTQLALRYANTSRDKYRIIAWIPAETEERIMQAFASLASSLGLVEDPNEVDHRCLQTVREWLNTTEAPFLLIFDNLENSELLTQVWPTSDKGSVLITTRSPSEASNRNPLTFELSPFSIETSTAAFKTLSGRVTAGHGPG